MLAFICITNTGDTALGANLILYSNVDNFTGIIETIPLTSLVAPNCPYLANVPDGATTLRLIDPNSGCCFTLPFGVGFNLCEICEPLGFSDATNPNIGSISVGQLTGGCDPNISNYYLEWYGPGTGSTNMIFTSGFGTNTYAGNYQRLHPLTGDSQVYLYPGQYRPKIREVELDNSIFSSDYGAYGDCFQDSPLVVSPYTISNGSAAPEPYQHCIELNTNGALSSTGLIELSGTTNYVPFRLNGGAQADLLRIYFSGASYLTPIPIESIVIGSNAGLTSLNTEFDMTSSNINYKTFGDPGTFTKVLCLTGLTRSANDVLLFEITPQGTQPTDFTFCFTQLNTFDCEMCALTKPYTDYKIVTSTVTATTGNCGATQVTFSVSGCPSSVDVNEDLYKYIFSGSGSASVGNAYGSVSRLTNLSTSGLTGCARRVYNYLGSEPTCVNTVMGGLILYRNANFATLSPPPAREIRLITPTDNNETGIAYIESIINSFNETKQQAINNGIYNNSDPNNPAYWSYFTLYLPPFGSFPSILSTSCYFPGTTDPKAYNPITRAGDYEINLAAPTITLVTGTTSIAGAPAIILRITGKPFGYDPLDTILVNTFSESSPCFAPSCSSPSNNVYSVNNSIIDDSIQYSLTNQGDTTNIITGVQAGDQLVYNTNPWAYNTIIPINSGINLSATTTNVVSMYQYENKTFPLTGQPGTYGVLIADTATTCPNITNYTFDENSGSTSLNNYVRYNYYYGVTYIDNSDPTKYQILATQILSNGQPNTTVPPILVGSGTTTTFTVIEGAYFI